MSQNMLNACFAILNIATSLCVIQNCGVIYKTNTALIRTNPHNFSNNSTNICANSKNPLIHHPLFSSFQIVLLLMKRKKHFAKLNL